MDYSTEVTRIDGAVESLEEYRGKVLLVVNTASHCGFTPQYEGLEALWRQYRDRGLAVLGFPCDQFGHQEPGDELSISLFCTSRYYVSFPMHAKIDVNGTTAHPLFTALKDAAPGVLGTRSIKWNFTKFLVDREGRIVARYAPRTTPAQIAADIDRLLG
ncbi:MAG: glutathione peroxidase [Myxococcota bacterium]